MRWADGNVFGATLLIKSTKRHWPFGGDSSHVKSFPGSPGRKSWYVLDYFWGCIFVSTNAFLSFPFSCIRVSPVWWMCKSPHEMFPFAISRWQETLMKARETSLDGGRKSQDVTCLAVFLFVKALLGLRGQHEWWAGTCSFNINKQYKVSNWTEGQEGVNAAPTVSTVIQRRVGPGCQAAS